MTPPDQFDQRSDEGPALWSGGELQATHWTPPSPLPTAGSLAGFASNALRFRSRCESPTRSGFPRFEAWFCSDVGDSRARRRYNSWRKPAAIRGRLSGRYI